MLFRNLSIITLVAATSCMHAAEEKQQDYVAYAVVDTVNKKPFVPLRYIARMNVDDSTTLEKFAEYVSSRYTGYSLSISTNENDLLEPLAQKKNNLLKYTQGVQKTTLLKDLPYIKLNGSLKNEDYFSFCDAKEIAPLYVMINNKE